MGEIGGEAAWGVRGVPPLHSRKNFKFRFKKATKSAHFSSLRQVSDDFCTALYHSSKLSFSSDPPRKDISCLDPGDERDENWVEKLTKSDNELCKKSELSKNQSEFIEHVFSF